MHLDAHLVRRVLLSLILCATVLTGRAHAEDDDDPPRLHFQRGVELVDRGDFAAAVAEFERAYDASPHHVVLYNLGLVYAELSRPVDAVLALERYLRDGGDAIPPQRRLEAERELERQRRRTGRLRITVAPADAAVELDGRLLARDELGVALTLPVGLHRVTAVHPGHEREDALVTLGNDDRSIALALEPSLLLAPNAALHAPAPSLDFGQTVVARTEPPSPRPARLARALLATGAVLAVAAAGVFAWNRSRYDDYRAEARELANATPDGAFDARVAAHDDHYRSIRAASVVDVGLAATSAVLLATGATLGWSR